VHFPDYCDLCVFIYVYDQYKVSLFFFRKRDSQEVEKVSKTDQRHDSPVELAHKSPLDGSSVVILGCFLHGWLLRACLRSTTSTARNPIGNLEEIAKKVRLLPGMRYVAGMHVDKGVC
jgi:hypothetical protein